VNCLDFRRKWLVLPGARDLALTQHERVCACCRQFARRGSVFEHKLREALAIDAPAGLIERINQRRDIGEQVRGRQARPLYYALAASLLLMVGLVSLAGYQFRGSDLHSAGLRRSIIEHIINENEYLDAHDAVGMARLRPLFARFGARLKGDLGRVNYAAACSVWPYDGIHMVLSGQKGAVTVLYMNGRRIKDSAHFKDAHFKGILFPVPGGRIAVVGERGEALGKVVHMLREKLRWHA
jgi:hypothetical protein